MLLVNLFLANTALAASDEVVKVLGDGSHIKVSMQITQTVEIDNDLMLAKLSMESEGKDSARTVDQVNSGMKWALAIAQQQPDVNIRSGSYRTFPVYKNQRLHHWRAIQEVYLKSRNINALSQLVAKLQSRLQIKSMTLILSPEKRRTAENSMIKDAIIAFRKRADIISNTLQTAHYHISDISIDTEEKSISPLPFRNNTAGGATNTLAIAPGTTQVKITVSGSIEVPR
jgi:predicted secreted protein